VLRAKGRHAARVLTAGGEVELARPYFWAKGEGGACPADAALGIDGGDGNAGDKFARVSPGAREVMCRMGVVQDFAGAARDAGRIGNVPVGKEKLRQVVEAEAAAVAAARNAGALPAAWSAADAAVDEGDARTRVYEGTDGVMVPTVTQAEKDKRRQSHAVRRQQRSAAGVGNAKPLAPARPGTDERFKEMKVGAFYDQPKRHRHAFATEANSGDYGPLLKEHARQVGFDAADETISLVDGARWIATQVCAALVLLKALLLDFYHLSEHVYDAAKCCLGDTPAAAEWARARLAEVKEVGAAPVLAAIDALSKQVRAKGKREALRRLRAYLADRLDMLDYRTALANGWDIGSGPTEAECKTLTLRLKRPGARWDRDHAAAIMNLKAMYESGQSDLYWPDARKAAA
jgi:hypothetical protein